MSGWRHGSKMQTCHAVVPRTDSDRFFVKSCGCDRPTPDPASPACDWWTRAWGERCAREQDHPMHQHPDCFEGPHEPATWCHPFTTRCTCGHVIERINPGPAASGSEGGIDHG